VPNEIFIRLQQDEKMKFAHSKVELIVSQSALIIICEAAYFSIEIALVWMLGFNLVFHGAANFVNAVAHSCFHSSCFCANSVE